MKFIFILGLILTVSSVFAWYPHKHNSELRMVASQSGPLSRKSLTKLSKYSFTGQLLKKQLSDDVSIGAMFELGDHQQKAKLGALVNYKVNPLLDVAVAGDLNQARKLGASMWFNLNLKYKEFLIKPFININHKKLAESGVILYKEVQDVSVHIGIAYAPNIGERKREKITFVFGTSFSDKSIINKFFGEGST